MASCCLWHRVWFVASSMVCKIVSFVASSMVCGIKYGLWHRVWFVASSMVCGIVLFLASSMVFFSEYGLRHQVWFGCHFVHGFTAIARRVGEEGESFQMLSRCLANIGGHGYFVDNGYIVMLLQ